MVNSNSFGRPPRADSNSSAGSSIHTTSSAAPKSWIRRRRWRHGFGSKGCSGARLPSKPRAPTLARVRDIREELRALARRNNGIACDCAFDALEEASGRSHFAFSFDGPGNVARLRAQAPGVDGVIGTILAAVQAAMADKTWPRLKACADETCEFAYYDHSKNGCSRWCSAETCGNRSKVKRYRERQAKGTG
jgi:predicted RNA-binding Zn ribbon-like protein